MLRWMPRVHHLTCVRQGREYQGETRISERRGRGVVDKERMRERRGGKCEAPEFTLGGFLAALFSAEEAAALRDFCFGDVFFFFGGLPIFRPVTCTDHSKTLWEGRVQQDMEHLARRFRCWCKS